jgi:hypothetical protein
VATPQAVIAAIDQVVRNFNKRTLDLPDGFFDRKAQFVINGATFESLLSATPDDPLVLMLARGNAGYRFTIKALQHAMPDARIERASIADLTLQLRLVGTLRGSSDAIDSVVTVKLTLNDAGLVNIIDATMNEADLEKIRRARLQSG